jgi:transposase-like protein
MYARSAPVAAKRFREWKQRWQDKIPKTVNCVEKDFDKLIPVFEFPEAIRFSELKKLRPHHLRYLQLL